MFTAHPAHGRRTGCRVCINSVLSALASLAIAAAALAQPAELTGTPTPTPTPAQQPRADAPDGRRESMASPGTASTPRVPNTGPAELAVDGPSPAPVHVCGSITTDTTWTSANVYVIDGCTVTVEPGATLRIEAGTIVKLWYWDWKIRVRGALLAQGTSGAPVAFVSLRDDSRGGDTNGDGQATTARPGDWGLIAFEGGSTGRLTNTLLAHGGWFSGFGLRAMIAAGTGADIVLDGVTLEQSARGGLHTQNAALVVRRSSFTAPDDAIRIDGLSAGAALEISDCDFTTTHAGQAAGRIALGDHPARIVLERNRAAGSGWNGFVFSGDVVRDLELRSTDSLPLISESTTNVEAGAALRIARGAVFKFRHWDWRLRVHGGLFVDGSEDAPVVFTSLRDDAVAGDTNGDGTASVPAPRDWGLIGFEAGSEGRLSHATIAYGGYFSGFGLRGMVEAHGTDDVFLDDVTVAHAAIDGIYVTDASMIVRGAIRDNDFGVRNGTPSKGVVDARRAWWGDASGPLHRTKNPHATGNEVSDGVLFFPWAEDASGHVPSRVSVEGPVRVSPGETVDVAIRYFPELPLSGALLVASLPWSAEFVDATGGAVHWPARHQVIWKLGDLAATDGVVSLRLRYEFGLPNESSDAVFASLAAANAPSPDIDLEEYANYTPRRASSQVVLSAAQMTSELDASTELRVLYDRAVADGYLVPRATRTTTSAGEEALEILMLQPERAAVVYLTRVGDQVTGVEYGRDVFRAYDAAGGMSWDVALDRFATWGSWNATATAGPRGALSFARCFFNCVAPKLTLAVIKKTIKSVGAFFKLDACFTCGLSKGTNLEACTKCENAIKPLLRVNDVPILGETIDVTKCAADCAGQQGVVFPCLTDLLTCDSSVTRGVWTKALEQCAYRRIPCENNVLAPEKSYVVNSGLFTDFAKCVEGKGCQRCAPGTQRAGDRGAENPSAETCDVRRTTVRAARDPNEKSASRSALLAGEEIEYRIDYENEGAGIAYDVFVVDELHPGLDETTLDLGGSGELLAEQRTILWSVGDLGPKGSAGSSGSRSFRVRARGDLADGAVIDNSAVVHFPSVPEETRTNAVVSVVEPLVAESRTLETTVGVPLDIVLTGRTPGAGSLTFAVVDSPLEGTLTGTAPSLRYAPPANFTGQDRLSFTVSDGTRTSRPGEVTVSVLPGDGDTVAPTVLWTYPEPGAVFDELPSEPAYTDGDGPAYLPVLRAGCSEAMAPTTVTAESVRLTGPGGAAVPTTASWDGNADAVVLVPRAPWVRGGYTITVSDAVTDASGNALAAPFVWSFRVGAAGCVGDCNGDGQVNIDELVRGVNIALGAAAVDTCVAMDANDDRAVSIAELIGAVNRALAGCGDA